ncbi:unnamed protein product, partial [Cuscuta epithymum]
MASFLWGSNSNKKNFHWAKWSRLCYPIDEGGLGFRALADVEKAYTLKLWWRWKNNKSAWCEFVKARYPRGEDMRSRITDSNVWRRICGIHDMAASLCSYTSSGTMQWDPGIHGLFSLASAYNEIRDTKFVTFTDKHIWHKNQTMQVKFFLWKLLNSFLPISENMQRFQITLQPSRCPLCRSNCETTDHIFFNCSYSKKIWQYFMAVFGINMPMVASIRQIMILWWIEAGSK